MRKNFFLLLVVLIYGFSYSQETILKGIVTSNGKAVENVSVKLLEEERFTKTDPNGQYLIKNVPLGVKTIVLSSIGYQTLVENIEIYEGENIRYFDIKEDFLNIESVVVTATRSEIPQYKSPVIVSRISSKSFETTQSLNLSEGLNFTPGLRLENNCQNCGFTQVRMNGLEGPYSQILINSRPIFSALMGVYGLDMIPANMIDRVEVVRGGGSVLYGGSSIAGTINIITKDPIENSLELSLNQSYINLETPDRTISVNGSIVSEDYNKGASFYAYNRKRDPWDANDDDFSEMTQLDNTTFGVDTYWNTSDDSKIKANMFNINEFRRGGNKFDLPAHQADITEQLDHKILGAGISYEQFFDQKKQKLSMYSSAQKSFRNSYYGGGGKILSVNDTLTEEDLLAINAYGKSKDFAYVGGLQYSNEFSDKLFLISGVEYQNNNVLDQMPGYKRTIDQKVSTLGAYSQLEIKPNSRISFLIGARYENIDIKGKYDLDIEKMYNNKNINMFAPRFTAMYDITEYLKFRASYAQGYRTPQAFDEDLHVETAAGGAIFVQLDPNLKTEQSNSINASINFTKYIGNVQTNIVLEGFYTNLNNTFITSDATELPNGIMIMTKRNGKGSVVQGINLEANMAFSRDLFFQFGGTLQKAIYKENELIWQNEQNPTESVYTKNLLRTPNLYGYYILNYNILKNVKLSLSGVYTGRMDVAHIVDPDTIRTEIKRVKDFFENNIKIAYDLNIKNSKIQFFGGVQNIFNQYQKDFDMGKDRDSKYIYGPNKPRTVFAGVKYSF
ncbi:MAG: TonB-dependent receptor [Bacteroidota bacterium]|nr:TonB-dependent receptor [Bacteroidota bacterium]